MLPDDGGGSGGRGGDVYTLDEVIVVKRPDSLTRHSANRTKSGSPNNKKESIRRACHSRSCRCQHGTRGRQRHNATQTPDSVLCCSRHIHSCHRHNRALDCCSNIPSNSCLMNGDLKTGEITCHCHITHHCHRYSPGSGSGGVGISGDGKEKKSHELCCHNSCSYKQHHSYHRHQQPRHNRRNDQHNHNYRKHHHHHHHYRHLQPTESQTANAAFNIRQLSGYNSKSSFDSSDDLQLSAAAAADMDGQLEHLQEIEIEIDAATMTEGNTSTATSNFAYKMAKGNITAAPIIMAPLHDYWEEGRNQNREKQSTGQRCDSMNSNSTAETDELSRSNRGERNDGDIATNNSLNQGPNKNAHHSLWGSRDINDLCNTNNTRTELTKTDNGVDVTQTTTPPQLICCDDSLCCGGRGVVDISNRQRAASVMAHNECVKIRRKLFKASEATLDDCCSTCSHCSNCSCQQNADATSCSSFDDLDADDDDEDDYEGARRHKMAAPHELIVAAECHICHLQQRRSTSSTGGEEVHEVDVDVGVGDDDDNEAEDRLTKKMSRQLPPPSKRIMHRNTSTTNSSAQTSRRSSASYCSCHSSTCYCCECTCRGDADGHDSGDVASDDDDVDVDDCDTATTGQMLTARDTSFTAPLTASAAAADFDTEHSSTLTPLTNASSSVVSTPGAEEADITLRSFNNTLTEDIGGGSSSLSQSAEYFSLSSNNQSASRQMSPADTPVHRQKYKLHREVGSTSVKRRCNLIESTGEHGDEDGDCDDDVEIAATSRKPCKHYSKHHRHKRSHSPLDGYL